MFGEKEQKRLDTQMNGFLGQGVTLTGKLHFEGSVRIDGNLNGEVEALSGTLVIGEGALLQAKIKVDTAFISGEFKGDIDAKSRIELKAPARVFGNIRTPNLIIGEGVIFEGTCEMSDKKGGAALREVEEKKREAL